MSFSDHEISRIVQCFLGPAGARQEVFCPRCENELLVKVQRALGMQLEVCCESCGEAFTWAQPQPSRDWKPLHLDYFRERCSEGLESRCPYDDCYITVVFYSGGLTAFICPYCNRRGTVELQME